MSRDAPKEPNRVRFDVPKEKVSPNARRVIRVLRKGGYAAYIVGGAVRDLALGMAPKDFDIATDATPHDVRRELRRRNIKGRIIGRRFRLVHAYFPEEVIEISTFRQMAADSDIDETGRLLSDNVFGTEREDAWRRDFTANALFYDPEEGVVIDHTGGLNDIERRQLRIIGDPHERYPEDPVRMLRAVRLATKLSLKLERRTAAAIASNLPLLGNVPPARLFDELTKIVKGGSSRACMALMAEMGMASLFIPHHDRMDREMREWLYDAMSESDRRVRHGETVSLSLFVACMFWPPLEAGYRELVAAGARAHEQYRRLFEDSELNATPLFTNRVRQRAMDIWMTMARMETASRAKQVASIRRREDMRVALAFLRLRSESDESLVPTVLKWEEVAEAGHDEAADVSKRLFAAGGRSRRGRRRKAAGPGTPGEPA